MKRKTKFLFLSFQITKECCSRCLTCSSWHTKNTEKLLTKEEIIKGIHDFSNLIIKLNDMEKKTTYLKNLKNLQYEETFFYGVIAFTGGEPFLREKELFQFIEECYKLDIGTIVLTNGLLIDETIYSKIRESHLSCLSFSFESCHPEIQNYIRGRKDSFEKIVQFLKNYPSEDRLKVTVNLTLNKKNIDSFIDTVYFLKSLNLDEFLFQPVMNQGWYKTKFTDKNIIDDYRLYDNLIEDCRYLPEPFWEPIIARLTVYSDYLKNNEQSKKVSCITMTRGLMINADGKFLPCNLYEKTENLLSIRDMTIRDYWFSPERKKLITDLTECREHCMLLNCHCSISDDTSYYISLRGKDENFSSAVITK